MARWIWEAGGWWIPHRVTNSSRCLVHTQEDSWFQSDSGTSSGNDSLCLDWRLGNSFESLEMFSPKQIELHKTLFSFWYWNLCSTTIELQIPVIHATHSVNGCQKKKHLMKCSSKVFEGQEWGENETFVWIKVFLMLVWWIWDKTRSMIFSESFHVNC